MKKIVAITLALLVLAAGLGIILMILFFAGRETILRMFGATENNLILL